jgi:hypothetical protein
LALALQALQLRFVKQPRRFGQLQRCIAPQGGMHFVGIWPTAGLPQGLQNWQAQFLLTMTSGTLSPCHPYCHSGTETSQPPINHHRLADSRFATDIDKLAANWYGTLEPPLQGVDFGLPPHHRSG